MANPKCAVCGGTMKRNGKTKAGTQRWRCPACGASSVRRIDTRAKELGAFLRWLLSKRTTSELPGSRTSFWRRTSWVWGIWPIAHATGEVHDVVHLDGIWIRVFNPVPRVLRAAWKSTRSAGGPHLCYATENLPL